MLNRLYIVVGILAILVLGAGFIVPGLMDWNGYRARLEALAEATLGTDVIIGGEISFTLLPQPKIRFGKTIVGPAFSPLLEIDSIEADFSLMDFLRDRFVVTKLVLQSPRLNLVIDKLGNFEIPIELQTGIEAEKISVADAEIVNGMILVRDERSQQKWTYEEFDGELGISGLNGPYSMKGVGVYLGERISARLNISAINNDQNSLASFFWKPVSGSYSVAGEGNFEFGSVPKFIGEVAYRGAPVLHSSGDDVFGDFIISSQVELSPEKLLLSAFELQPDENQAGSRLTGAAVVRFGETGDFDAVISGGVVSFAPRDIREKNQNDPYLIIGFLNQLSLPFSPSISGRIGVDIAELNVQGFSLRDVRLDATSDGNTWKLNSFLAQIAGGSKLRLEGQLSAPGSGFGFAGHLSLQTERLGALARLWKPVDATSVLHNMAGGIEANLQFGDGILKLDQGQISVGETSQLFDARFELDAPRSASVSLSVGKIDGRQSEALLELFPGISSEGSFVNSFPQGNLELDVEQADLAGMSAQSLALQMDWDALGIHIDRVSVFDLGGVQFSLSGELSGQETAPQLTGGGRITFGVDAAESGLPFIADKLGMDASVEAVISRSLPIDVRLDVSPAQEGGLQIFSAEGRAGAMDVTLTMNMDHGLAHWLDGPIMMSGSIRGENPDLLTTQLGLGAQALVGDGEAIDIQFTADGVFGTLLETQVVVRAGNDQLGFDGTLNLSDLTEVSGKGKLDFSIGDFAGLQNQFGIGTMFLPSMAGNGDIAFGANGALSLSELSVFVGEARAPVSGVINLNGEGKQRIVSGNISVGALDVSEIVSLVAGPASLIQGDTFWPEGPVDLGVTAALSKGRIMIETPKILVEDRTLISDVSFDLAWRGAEVSLENISGKNGGGQVAASLTICCSILDVQKQISGRISLNAVPISGVVSMGIGENIAGILDAGVFFEASGATIDQMAKSLNGEGSFSLDDVVLRQLDPVAFSTLVLSPDIAELDEDALAALVGISLDQGNFETLNMAGLFQIAGGKIRADNISASNEDGRLLTDIHFDLEDLSIEGNWVLSPSRIDDPTGLIDQNSAQIVAVLGGSFGAPTRVLDMGQMVEAIKLRALEIELDQLEILRAEQLARSAELARNRARMLELEAQRKEEEAARLAAEEELHRLEREEAADAAALEAQNAVEEPLTFELDSQDPLLLQEQLLLSDPSVINLQPTDLLGP